MIQQIYSNAVSTLVWLSADEDGDEGNIAFGSLSKRHWSEGEASAVLALFQNSYWRRIWII